MHARWNRWCRYCLATKQHIHGDAALLRQWNQSTELTLAQVLAEDLAGFEFPGKVVLSPGRLGDLRLGSRPHHTDWTGVADIKQCKPAARFHGIVECAQATVRGEVCFCGVEFHDRVSFAGVRFAKACHFRKALFAVSKDHYNKIETSP